MDYAVMIVDDSEINLLMLENILDDAYDVIPAQSGEEALAKLNSGAKPDLILLDLYMPGIDGFEVILRINQSPEYSTIPVIIVTSENDEAIEEKGIALGAVDYITKPYNARIIRLKIENHIELKILRDKLTDAVAARTKELSESYRAVILGMSLLAETRDKVTGAHLLRTEQLTRILARHISKKHPQILNKEMAELIARFSPLHDVGKIGVPDAVLNKVGKLTDDEFTQIKAHSTEGCEILRQVAGFLPNDKSQLHIATEIAHYHHERFDGTGYPCRLCGESIPISARIVSIVDVYDALRSARPYKEGFSHEKAIDIILNGDGRSMPCHFDPLILAAFADVKEELCQAFDENPDPKVEDA